MHPLPGTSMPVQACTSNLSFADTRLGSSFFRRVMPRPCYTNTHATTLMHTRFSLSPSYAIITIILFFSIYIYFWTHPHAPTAVLDCLRTRLPVVSFSLGTCLSFTFSLH